MVQRGVGAQGGLGTVGAVQPAELPLGYADTQHYHQVLDTTNELVTVAQTLGCGPRHKWSGRHGLYSLSRCQI